MKVYSYFLKSASCDYHHVMSLKRYDSAVDFMKNEIDWEYEAWKDLGYSDDDIPYDEFDRQELEV